MEQHYNSYACVDVGRVDEDVTRMLRVSSYLPRSILVDTADTRDILVTCYKDVARVGRVREDATRKLLPWNLGLCAACACLCVSVTLRYIVSKRLDSGSRKQYHTIAQGL